ncbi:hypothetical protein FGO68_gene13503 [Halteria grandinella]|uniref:Casein kinase II subunit beta n=1 Tax=Halteria grandinella TaxID=5974 RepID=A0A8J8SYW4_HALGN|nr:hypothetical protein FGO68_gene13503 [Halteria grandinella]
MASLRSSFQNQLLHANSSLISDPDFQYTTNPKSDISPTGQNQSKQEEDSVLKIPTTSWIDWHCSQEGNQFLVKVTPAFYAEISHNSLYEDQFNDLKHQFTDFDEAVKMKYNAQPTPDDIAKDSFKSLYTQSCHLYGLLHALFLQTTPSGLDHLLSLYDSLTFGTCPHVSCSQQPLLPVGLSDSPGKAKVKVYCPRCQEVYHPRGSVCAKSTRRGCDVDGAYFGKSLPAIVMERYPERMPKREGI